MKNKNTTLSDQFQ